MISGAQVKENELFSPKASIFLGTKAGLTVKVGGKKVPLRKHHEEKAEAPKVVEESEEKER